MMYILEDGENTAHVGSIGKFQKYNKINNGRIVQ